MPEAPRSETDASELPQGIVPGHHAMARAAFSWGEDDDGQEMPQGIVPGHHAMARAAFSWGEQEA